MKLTLKALRVNKNMTQSEAAKAVGVSPSTWAHYGQGKTYPSTSERSTRASASFFVFFKFFFRQAS